MDVLVRKHAPYLSYCFNLDNNYLVAEKTFLSLRSTASSHPEINFVAVSHSDQPSTDRWLASLPDPSKNTQPNLQVVVDAEREAYAAWGLGTSSFWHVLGSIPSVKKLGDEEGIWNRDTESGNRWQTGGCFGIDGKGIVKWGGADGRADDVRNFGEGVREVLGVRGEHERVGIAEAMQG